MEGKKLAKFLLLMMVLDLLLFSSTDGWRRRRRRRRRCSAPVPSGIGWVNSWHSYFSFNCRNTRSSGSLRFWRSHHSNCVEDRIHYFRCGYAPINYKESHCSWSYYGNDYDQPLTFRCHNNGFIAGVASVYHGGVKDRRFSFRCCHKRSYIQHSCKNTNYLNNWDKDVRYTVPHGYYLAGVHSYHSNYHEDRRWRFEICKFSRKCKGQG